MDKLLQRINTSGNNISLKIINCIEEEGIKHLTTFINSIVESKKKISKMMTGNY